jgi:hypothetical protein
MRKARITKHITWSCARLSFSILLQDRNVDEATVAYLMGSYIYRLGKKNIQTTQAKESNGNYQKASAARKPSLFLCIEDKEKSCQLTDLLMFEADLEKLVD